MNIIRTPVQVLKNSHVQKYESDAAYNYRNAEDFILHTKRNQKYYNHGLWNILKSSVKHRYSLLGTVAWNAPFSLVVDQPTKEEFKESKM